MTFFPISRSAKVGLVALALIGLLIPTASFAYEGADQGKITIRVTDETGVATVGNWYLHFGSTEKGSLVRNGLKGETFTFPAGTYFFVTQPASNLRPYRLIRSDNPQRLIAGGSITFSVQYFKTEEQKKAAIMANSTDGSVVEPQPVVPETVTPAEPVAPSVPTPSVTPAPATPAPATTRTPLSGAELEVPAWLYENSEPAVAAPTENRTMNLAVTGPSTMAIPALLGLSILLSAIVLRKKNV